jgi:hypothetical protein
MKKLFTLTLAGLILGVASIAFSATLVDVPSGHWAEDAVTKLINAGLVEGYPDGTYKGDRPMTRYEYAMVISRLMDKLDSSYCGKDECKAGAPAAAVAGKCDCPGGAAGVSPEQLEEMKSIVKKLAAEFKDELAALKVKVDENSVKIDSLEKKVNNAFIGKLQVKGSIRQRIDAPGTDLSNANFAASYKTMYNVTGVGASGLTSGYEMVPSLTFTGNAGDNVNFSIGLDQYINNQAMIGSKTPTATALDVDHAYVDMDFSKMVRELDVMKIRSGYQKASFGPYGMLVDNYGVQSSPGVLVSVAKDMVSFAGFGIMIDPNNTFTSYANTDGLGSTGKDLYTAGRVGLNLPFVNLGVNYLGSGLGQEKGWGVDTVVPILKNSPFLKELRGEYLKMTDTTTGVDVSSVFGVNAQDDSFMLGLDLYKNKKAGLTLSYADLPAAPALTSLLGSPFNEFNSTCPRGLDINSGACISFNDGNMLFPAGFSGLGVQASYLVFGDVELAGKAIVGDFAGGSFNGASLDGEKYPGYGAVSVTKPINSDSKFRVEYMQQGKDPIVLNRVRGELLINF